MSAGAWRRSFGSRVARGVFLAFLASALAPVGVLGAFAWLRSSAELERAAREDLRRDGKREGMTILSRLLVADALLRALGEDSGRVSGESARFAAEQARVWRRFERALPARVPGGALTSSEQRALARGKTGLRFLRPDRVLLIAPRTGADGRHLVGEIEPSYLWTFDANDASSSLSLFDELGNLVFSTLPPDRAGALARSAEPRDLIAESWTLFLGSRFGAQSLHVVRAETRAEMLAPLAEFRLAFGLSALLAVCVVGVLASFRIRSQLGPIESLTRAASELGAGRFDARAQVARDDEFGQLGAAFDAMAARIERHVRAIESASELGLAVAAERSPSRLVSLVLRALVDSAHAGGAGFARVSEDGSVQLETTTGSAPPASAAADAAVRERAPVQRDGLLALPLFDHAHRLFALLLVWGPRGDQGQPLQGFLEAEAGAARAFASQAAIGLTNLALVDEFRSLFEGLIELTVKALDAKSPYTAGHCRRVPVLADLLSDAVCRTRSGPFAEFEFSSDERYELKIAALLHDFGKIVTPVHVMDKSTKLQTIHDRIEEVATRFAVIEREAEIAWLRGLLARTGTAVPAWPGDDTLRDELAFLRSANTAEERMAPAAQARVREIAATRRWCDAAGTQRPVLDALDVENLTISRGTLTEAERRVIEEHADHTIQLLGELPFPRHLRNVARIAGSHHERLDGGGYPLGLRGAEITLQGRLLGLADVFEALTAPDRPYRDPIPVSEAIEVMRGMVKAGHLDGDLLDVFLAEGVHLTYARKQLLPEQLDDATLDALARLPGGPLPPR